MSAIRLLLSLFMWVSVLAGVSQAGEKYGEWYGDEEPGTIVIITSDHTLHLVGENGTRTSYPIAVGKEGMQWTGETVVIGKRRNPEWRPTPAMRKRNPKLPAYMKGGKGNPLGAMAIYLDQGYLRIHGNNDETSIGKNASSGCFRMYNDDVVELAEQVKVGAKVVVLP